MPEVEITVKICAFTTQKFHLPPFAVPPIQIQCTRDMLTNDPHNAERKRQKACSILHSQSRLALTTDQHRWTSFVHID